MRTHAVIGLATLSTLLPCQALGQSSFAFRNLDFGVDAPVYNAFGIPLEGPGYLSELWGGPSVDSLSPAVQYSDWDTRLIVPFLTGGYVVPRDVVLTSVGPGHLAALQMRAWDASLGATYEEVAARGLGGYGESTVFYGRGGNPLGLPTLPSPLVGLESFGLRAVIPEPSTWALFAIGALALGFRRVSGRFKTSR